MNLQDLQKRAEGLDVRDIIKNLKGQHVPVSNTEKLELLDANEDEFKFERKLTDKELSFFKEWLKGKIQNGIKQQLGI